MKKVIVLSTVLGLSALGMACGEAASNNAANKPANVNVSTPAPVSTVAPVSTPAANTNMTNANKPANTAAVPPAANKPANATATPKKP